MRRKLGSFLLVFLAVSGLIAAVVRERSRACQTRGGEPSRMRLACVEAELDRVWSEVAGRHRLTFDPARPRPGDVVSVTYRAGSRFAGQDRLSLRSQIMGQGVHAWESAPIANIATLERAGDVFLGTFRLPPDALYLQLVVESVAGDEIDANAGHKWEITTHEEDGDPRYDALVARARANWDEDADRLRETGRVMQKLAPRRPWGRFARVAAEEMIAGTWGQRVTRGPTARAYRSMYADLRDRPGLEEQDLVALSEWSWRILHSSQREWGDRLVREFPHGHESRVIRDHRARSVTTGNSQAALDSVTAIWGAANLPEPDFADEQLTAVAHSPGALVEIIGRYPELSGTSAAAVAGYLPDSANYRDLRRRLQQDAARGAYVPAREIIRAITQTVDEHAAEQRSGACSTAAYVAHNLVKQGARIAAKLILDAVPEEVAEFECDELLAMRASERLMAGDSAGALADWTEYAAQAPERRTSFADSARRVSPAFDTLLWHERVSGREREVWRRTLASSTDLPVGDFDLITASGERVAFRGRWLGAPIVVMMTTSDALRGRASETVGAMAEGVAPLGIHWVAVVRGRPILPSSETTERDAIPVYFDPRGEAGEALGQRRLREFVVMDARGRIRFRTDQSHIARRRAVMLTAEAELNASHSSSIASASRSSSN